ncbi:MAG: hypothetical protein ABI843_17575 [Dokdonella sp.]
MSLRARRALFSLGVALAVTPLYGRETMDEVTRERMAAAAARTYHWIAADVEVRPNDELDRDGCHFFMAIDTNAASHAVGNYALLADGRLAGVDITGNAAAAALLKACGRGASADWWASVVVRFSEQVGGLVLTADGNPFAIRKIKDAGVEFVPPALERDGDATRLAFFVMDVGLNQPSHVQADLSASGTLDVAVTPVQVPARASGGN